MDIMDLIPKEMSIGLILLISLEKLSYVTNVIYGYNINVTRQSACLVINLITVDSFASLFNCTPVADSMMDPT